MLCLEFKNYGQPFMYYLTDLLEAFDSDEKGKGKKINELFYVDRLSYQNAIHFFSYLKN